MNEKFSVIYADPPWSYDDKSKHRGGAERHYRTMGIDWIASLSIKDLAADDSVLFLWVTWPQLREGLRVIESWGFTYKTIGFLWVKKYRQTDMFKPTDFWGMGHWTRSNTEPCLMGIRGKPKRASGGVHSVIEAVPRKHSAKPPEVRDRIVQLCGDLPRVELFAREPAEGWQIWGNEVESDIELSTGSS